MSACITVPPEHMSSLTAFEGLSDLRRLGAGHWTSLPSRSEFLVEQVCAAGGTSARTWCSLFEEHGFTDLKISVNHHDPVVMISAYSQLAAACDYPLHLGATVPKERIADTLIQEALKLSEAVTT